MAKKPNQNTMNSIIELHAKGLTDAAISRILGKRGNLIQHYRQNILNLEPNWIKREFISDEQRTVGYILRNVRYSAKRRGLDYALNLNDLTIPKTCPLLGIELCYRDFDAPADFNNNAWATLDRFDNNKGYVPGNVWIISRLANTMKNSASLDQLETFANSILKSIENHRALGSITVPVGLDP
jgi:hypothetical protein